MGHWPSRFHHCLMHFRTDTQHSPNKTSVVASLFRPKKSVFFLNPCLISSLFHLNPSLYPSPHCTFFPHNSASLFSSYMDNQDHRKTHVSGHESHGVHLCHKCGWPFPNPHPSARHRRAHKRVCGTVEGYRLVDSGETNNHGVASDDDHLSDEDHKTPFPQVLDGGNEKNVSGIEAVSNRSEDEVFSDAAVEFQDSGFASGSSNSQENASNPAVVTDKVSGKGPSSNPSLKDCANTESSTDRSQGTQTLSGGMQECQDHASSSKEPIDMLVDDTNVLGCNLQHAKLETSADVSEENITRTVGMTECSMVVGQETDAEGNKEINVGTNLLDDVVSLIKHAGETSKQASKSELSLKRESDTVLTDGIVPSEEDFSLGAKMSMSEHTGQGTDGKGNPGTNMEGNLMDSAISQGKHVNTTYDMVLNVEKNEEVTPHIELPDEIIQVEEVPQSVLASNVVGGYVSPKAEPTGHISASFDTAHIKVDTTQTIDFLNSNEDYDRKGYAIESEHVLSVPGDIPSVDHAEMKLEDFKDHKRVHLYQALLLASGEIIEDREDEIQDSLAESRKLRESVDDSASDIHVLEHSSKHEDQNINPMVKGEVQVKVRSDEIGGSITTENEKANKASSPGKQQLNDTCDDIRQPTYYGIATRIFSDTNPSVALVDSEVDQIAKANIVSTTNDAAGHEEAESGVCTIDDDRKVNREHSIESMTTSFKSPSNPSQSHDYPVSGLLEGDAGDHGKGETDNFVSNEVESVEGQREEGVTTKTNSISELTSNHQENKVVVEDGNDDCLRKLRETESTNVDEVSKIPEETRQHEINVSGEVQGSCAAEFSLAVESDNGGKTGLPSEGRTNKELPSFPVDVEATIQGLAPVENNNSRESGETSYGVSSCSLQGEAGNSFVKHQLDTPAVDAFVESSSQTDSLEGNCESVFSLAVESDNGERPDFQKTPNSLTDLPSEGQTKKELPSKGQTEKELPSFPEDVEPTIQCLGPVENNNTRESGEGPYVVSSRSLQGEAGNSFVKHQLDTTAVDISVESSSQTDSLEGNWGSVSVLSTISDFPAGIDTDALVSMDSQHPAEAEKGNLKNPKGASEGQRPDKSDVFEPPSFMTLVESGGSGHTVAASEIQTGKDLEQLKASAMQAGWFPSLTHMSNESPGRKKNEEIIAKVTNWNVKQHTPLKNLLVEAKVENKPNSPNSKDNPATVIQRDEKVLKDDGASAMKVSSIPGHEAPVGKPAKTAREWDSPARYPADIKTEKRKVKGRPYWVQFVCCSSVN